MTEKELDKIVLMLEGKKSQVKRGDWLEIKKILVNLQAASLVQLELEGSASLGALELLMKKAEKVAEKKLEKMKLAKKKKK